MNSQHDLRRTCRKIGRRKDKKENIKKGGTGRRTCLKAETGRTGAGGQAVGQAGDYAGGQKGSPKGSRRPGVRREMRPDRWNSEQ